MTGIQFKKIRKLMKYTQQELAEKLELSLRGVQKIEKEDKVRAVNEFSILWIARTVHYAKFSIDYKLVRTDMAKRNNPNGLNYDVRGYNGLFNQF